MIVKLVVMRFIRKDYHYVLVNSLPRTATKQMTTARAVGAVSREAAKRYAIDGPSTASC